MCIHTHTTSQHTRARACTRTHVLVHTHTTSQHTRAHACTRTHVLVHTHTTSQHTRARACTRTHVLVHTHTTSQHTRTRACTRTSHVRLQAFTRAALLSVARSYSVCTVTYRSAHTGATVTTEGGAGARQRVLELCP